MSAAYRYKKINLAGGEKTKNHIVTQYHVARHKPIISRITDALCCLDRILITHLHLARTTQQCTAGIYLVGNVTSNMTTNLFQWRETPPKRGYRRIYRYHLNNNMALL